MKKYYTCREVIELFQITTQTLYNWRKTNKIAYKKLNKKTFMYDISNLIDNDNNINKINIIYTRVSNTKQKNDLIKQEQLLRNYCASNGLIVDLLLSDIASGMNDNRKNFNKLIELVTQNRVNKVIISYQDRLTRFGFNYFKKFFSLFNCEIIVINSTTEQTYEQELTEDLISIIHHFSMKMYSNRRKKLKQLELELRKK